MPLKIIYIGSLEASEFHYIVRYTISCALLQAKFVGPSDSTALYRMTQTLVKQKMIECCVFGTWVNIMHHV